MGGGLITVSSELDQVMKFTKNVDCIVQAAPERHWTMSTEQCPLDNVHLTMSSGHCPHVIDK